MEVRPGYKQTEIGILPEDWELVPFDSLGRVIDGDRGVNYPNGKDFSIDGYCLFLNAGNVTNSGFRFKACAFINREKDNLLNKGKLLRNDIVLTTRGTVGNFAFFNRAVPFEHIRINSGMVVLRNESVSLESVYLYDFVRSHSMQIQIERLSFGSAQPQLTVKGISKLWVVVPSTNNEQRAIAAALSDVDVLLDGLDRLIAKKRDIKQAAMQQLLTGKTRLPGFEVMPGFKQSEVGMIPEDWGLDHIENFAIITTGGKNTQDRVDGGQFPFFVRSQTVEQINSYSFDGEAVLTAGDGVGTGKVFHYINGKFDVHQRVYRISNFCNQVNGFYFYLYFSTHFYDRIMQMTAKSSVDSVRRDMIARMIVLLPPTETEQTAIATVLSDMDAEIEALEQRRTKTSDLKQAMIQELLTGRTRLVLNKEPH